MEIRNRAVSKNPAQEEAPNYTEALFDSIKHLDEYGQEFWYARELSKTLDYKRWEGFLNVIEKAKQISRQRCA